MKNAEFEILYNKYRNLLMKMVYNRSGNFYLAEEISQQVFIVFYQKMESIKTSLYKPWLMLATKNLTIDYMRKKTIREEIIAANPMDYHIVTHDNTEMIVERMVNAQLSFRILEDLKEKNETWYDVIEAVCVMEMRQEEAAEYLQISPQVVRARLYRARKYIRAEFEAEYKEY